jgi:hypothetical protein
MKPFGVPKGLTLPERGPREPSSPNLPPGPHTTPAPVTASSSVHPFLSMVELAPLPDAEASRATFYWPKDQVGALRAHLAAWALPLEVRVWPAPAAARVDSPLGCVYYRCDAHGPAAAAYALSTGRTAVRLPDDGPREARDGGSSVLIADLVETPFADLDTAGCIPWTDGFRGTAILPVDAHEVGGAMLLKNLLHRHGLLPRYGRRMYVNALAPRSLAAEDDDESYFFGRTAADVLRARLTRPVEHLLLMSHSNPFDSLLGEVILCALAGDASPGDGVEEPAFARGLPCLRGGPCIRAEQARVQRGIDVAGFLSPAALAPRHLVWLGCDVLALRDSVLVGRRSMAARLFAGPHLVTLVAPVRNEFPTAEQLLHLAFLLDGPLSAGTLYREHLRFVRESSGPAVGYLLIGDPDVRVGDAPDVPAASRQASPSVEEGVAPPALRWTLAAAEEGGADGWPPVAALDEPGAVFGYAAGGEGGRTLHMFAATDAGEVPARVTLRPGETGGDAAWLRTMLARVAFWRTLLWEARSKLPAGAAGEALDGDVAAALAELGAYEAGVAVGLEMLARRGMRVSTGARGHVQALRDATGPLGVCLLSVAQSLAARVNPKLFSRWLPSHLPAATPRLSALACGCGTPCDEHAFRSAVSGPARTLLVCPRCGTVSDYEVGQPRFTLAFTARAAFDEQPLRGVLSSAQGLPPGLILSASLAPAPGTEGALTLQAIGERPGAAGAYDLEFAFDPSRPRASQQVYLFACHELAFQMACAWTELGAPACAGAPAGDAPAQDGLPARDAPSSAPASTPSRARAPRRGGGPPAQTATPRS